MMVTKIFSQTFIHQLPKAIPRGKDYTVCLALHLVCYLKVRITMRLSGPSAQSFYTFYSPGWIMELVN